MEQWYERDKELLKVEVKAFEPLLKGNEYRWGIEPETKNLYVDIVLRPFELYGDRSRFDVRLMYMPNHPSSEYGFSGSVRVYPKGKFKESIEYLISQGHSIPHLIKDGDRNEFFLCNARPESFKAGDVNTSGAVMLKVTLKWIFLFYKTIKGKISFDDWREDIKFQ